MPSLTAVLQALYASEINASISCFWDAGWDVKLGDELNGFKAERTFENSELDAAAVWLVSEAKRAFPQSEFAKTWPDQ